MFFFFFYKVNKNNYKLPHKLKKNIYYFQHTLGELFDRIKLDCGTKEDTAKSFFRQLLDGNNNNNNNNNKKKQIAHFVCFFIEFDIILNNSVYALIN